MGCHSLLQEIFTTQGLNPCFLHWQADSLPLSHWEAQRTWIIEMDGDPSWKGLEAQKCPCMVADKRGQRTVGCGPVSILGEGEKNGNESEHHRDWKPQVGVAQWRIWFKPPSPHFNSGCGVIGRNEEHEAHVELFSSLCLYGCHYPTGNSLACKAQLIGAVYLIQLPHAGTPASGKCPIQGVVYKR